MPNLINAFYGIGKYIGYHCENRLKVIAERFSCYIMLLKPYIGRMMVGKKKIASRGQVLLEYGIVLVLIITALIGLQLYLQRGLQARYKDATDKAIREIRQARKESGLPLQYEPYYQESEITTESNSRISRSYASEGAGTTTEHNRTLRTGRRQELPYSDGVRE